MLQAGKSAVGGERLSGAQNKPVGSGDSRERSTSPEQPATLDAKSGDLAGVSHAYPFLLPLPFRGQGQSTAGRRSSRRRRLPDPSRSSPRGRVPV